MNKKIEALRKRLESDNEAPLTDAEIAYLNQIRNANDLSNYVDDGSGLLNALAYDAALALGLSKTKAMIIAGDIPAECERVIELYYHDGEYLNGYTLHGDNAKLLEKIGLARYVDGWGYYVKDAVVEKLGEKFEYRDAWEFAQPALARQATSERVARELRESKFRQARETGKPVVLDRYTDECNDPREECSLDNVTIYAMPDGSTKEKRSHTW